MKSWMPLVRILSYVLVVIVVVALGSKAIAIIKEHWTEIFKFLG